MAAAPPPPAPLAAAPPPPAPPPPAPLPPERLARRTDLSGLAFTTTAELAPIDGAVAQQRAADAIRLGSGIPVRGFNVFAIGASGARIRQAVTAVLAEATSARPSPPDWVYVNNFAVPHRPRAICCLPAGRPRCRRRCST